jgi:HEAT repeat protein
MIICPKCGGVTEYNLYFSAYQCLQNDCRYYKSKYDLTDEDKIYFNRQEGYERWELDEYIKRINDSESKWIDIEWYDGSKSSFDREYLLIALLKLHAKKLKNML